MTPLLLAGAAGGVVLGYALHRGRHCFHATWSELLVGRTGLAKAWLLAVAVGAVGLAAVDALGPWGQLNEGLELRPVGNVLGGVVFGVGMVVAQSCVSGLFYKLGTGMLGALAGLAGWAAGDVAGAWLDGLRGPQVLGFGAEATLPGLLGAPRWAVAGVLAVVVVAALARTRRDRPEHGWQWAWPASGLALGVALTLTWVAAGAGGATFGASTVGGARGLATGSPGWWQVAFLVALVPGALVATLTAGGGWVRGERAGRYAGLAVGGALLGVGAQVAGGCNLGHGLSGMAQMNVSSALVVASMVAGVALARAARRLAGRG